MDCWRHLPTSYRFFWLHRSSMRSGNVHLWQFQVKLMLEPILWELLVPSGICLTWLPFWQNLSSPSSPSSSLLFVAVSNDTRLNLWLVPCASLGWEEHLWLYALQNEGCANFYKSWVSGRLAQGFSASCPQTSTTLGTQKPQAYGDWVIPHCLPLQEVMVDSHSHRIH